MSAARKKKFESSNKDEVIHIRTAPTDKSIIEKAADSLGLTVSSFMLQNALKAARHELADIKRISLSKKEALAFANAILSPPGPNAALKSAFKTYEKHLK